jgi:hypothetical protein
MHKVVDEWDRERTVKKCEDAFNQAFDDIFDFEEGSEFDPDSEADSDSDSDSDSWETASWDTQEPEPEPHFARNNSEKDYYTEYILGEIVHLQKAYQKAEELGLDFEWYLQNEWLFEIEPSRTVMIEDDVFPHFKNLFVSNHKQSFRNKRVGKRVSAKTDTGFTTVFVLVF